MKLFATDIEKGADISECGVYRYRLWRRWGDGPSMTFIGVNPSTADAETDDQTIKKCIGFAKRHGCEAIQMLNLFAFRNRDTGEMKKARDPVGPRNDAVLLEHATTAKTVVVCWGGDGRHRGRDRQVVEMLVAAGVELTCFGFTQSGHPRHPVMLPYSAVLTSYLD